MKTYRAQLESTSPIQFSRYHGIEKNDKESFHDFEVRIWREKAHINDDGYAVIPALFFLNALHGIAPYLGMKTKGKGTYTKHFMSGMLILEPLVTDVKKEDLQGLWVQSKIDKSLVMKCFPTIKHWKGPVDYLVLDETITKAVLEYHIVQCGKFQGVGTYRPRNGGIYGRFELLSLTEIDCD
jgi:hypothetical protein